MADLHRAQLDVPAGAHPPDHWNHSDGVALRLDAVISKDDSGNPLSYVGDFAWDWTFYTPRKVPSRLNFYYWRVIKRTIAAEEITAARLALMRELQYLMVLRIFHSRRLLGFKSLVQDLFGIGKIARFAEEKGCSLRDVLEHTDLLDAYIADVPSSQCKDVLRWLTFLRTLDPVSELGFEVAEAKKLGELKRREKQYRDNQLQTAPLPTRIYLDLINALSSELDDIEIHRDRVLSAFREGLVLNAKHKEKGWKMGPSFGPDLIAKHDLKDFLTRKGHSADITGLTSAVTNFMRVCKTQIQTFSGMRDEESEYLPYHCMETHKAGHGRTHSLIVGVTTKLSGARRRRTKWVTTEAQGFRAIRLAQAFANVIYESLGVTPATAEDTKDHFPLFVSTSYLPWIPSQEASKNPRYAPSLTLGLDKLSESLKTALLPVIGVADVVELEAVNPFRDWKSEPAFAVGQPWPLKSHQLRRSLALYANASGLVKTSSLRRQLQHITREMTEYYGRGSAFAKNFLADDPKECKKHICLEWQDAEQEAQYLAFTRDVLNSDEPLCGPGGRFFDLQKQRGEVMSPQEVKDQLKMGRMAYKAHPLGGCTHLGTCDKQKGLRLTSGICISESCKSLVGKHSSILKLIPIQREIVSRIDPDSIAFHMEKEELDVLEAAEVQWQPANRALTSFPGAANV